MGAVCKTNKEVWRSYLSYLLPTVVGMVTYSLYCLADVLFISLGVGSDGLAALNISLPIFTIYSCIAILIGVGASVTMTICKGEGDSKTASKVLTMAVVSIGIIGSILMVLSIIFVKPIATILGANKEILEPAIGYLKPVTWGVLFYMLCGVLTVLVRRDGNPKLVMIAGVIGNLINIALDYIFIIPMKMGTFGAGLATAIGFSISMVILWFHFILKKNSVSFIKDFWDKELFKRMFNNGGGACILEISTGMTIFMINIALMKISGATAVAIYSVISNIAFIAKGMFGGMAQASQPIVSMHYGLKEYDTVKVVHRYAMWVAGMAGLITWIVIGLFSGEITAWLVDSEIHIIKQGQVAICTYLMSFSFMGLNTILMYYFQSLERPIYSGIMSFTRGIGLIFILLLILPRLWGELGVWLVLPVAEMITFVIFFIIRKKQVDGQLNILKESRALHAV